jgi:hypothetical protein
MIQRLLFFATLLFASEIRPYNQFDLPKEYDPFYPILDMGMTIVFLSKDSSL